MCDRGGKAMRNAPFTVFASVKATIQAFRLRFISRFLMISGGRLPAGTLDAVLGPNLGKGSSNLTA